MSLDLDAIKARAEAATSGPWLTPSDAGDPYDARIPIDHEGCQLWPWHWPQDMVFAYAARTDVPALIAEVERLTAERDRLRDTVAGLVEAP